MNKVIKISVTIDNDYNAGMKSTFTVSDMIFTEYSNLLGCESITENLSLALKQSKGFTMLTIDVYSYDSNNYSFTNDIILGIRYLSKYGEITKANLKNNRYENWFDATKKDIFLDLKNAVQTVNNKYIEFIKLVNV